MTYKPDICIYHDNCDDGYASAWVVNEQWIDVEFRASNYGQPAPIEDIEGKHVLIVDFSFSAEILMDMAKAAASVLVLDHHKTAQEALGLLPKVFNPSPDEVADRIERATAEDGLAVLVEFDMDRSGARMTWDFCNPGVEPPALIKHIEDRDLWRFYLEHTKKVSMFLRSLPRDFDTWSCAMEFFEADRNRFLGEAEAIERFFSRNVEEFAQTATLQTFDDAEGVPVVHVPYSYVSETCHELLELHPDAPFAVAVVKAHGGTTFSLRSQDHRADVSVVAKKHGGGGHRNAAGFRMPL